MAMPLVRRLHVAARIAGLVKADGCALHGPRAAWTSMT